MYNFSNMFEYGLLFYQPTVGLALCVSNGPQADGRQQYLVRSLPSFLLLPLTCSVTLRQLLTFLSMSLLVSQMETIVNFPLWISCKDHNK